MDSMNNTIFLKISIVFLIILVGFNCLKAQENLDAIHSRGDYWLFYNNAPHSLYHHIANEAIELFDKRNDEIKNYQGLKDWQKRQEWIDKTLLDIIGPFPPKTPLNVKVQKTINKKEYRIEHIIYESQPEFYVTSSLYIPNDIENNQKAPAILFCSGHSNEGYRTNTYQHIILNLVKKGFIVYAFDPIGQGERIQYYDTESDKSLFGGATMEHSYPGTQAFIIGSSQTRYMVWDGIRAIDYLFTRNEVDTNRIGITGPSGGGTQSALIAAFDDRIYVAAPERYITNFSLLLQSIGPTDAEQSLFNAVSRGLDHADLLLVRAPKPTLLIATTNDYFNIQGARETAFEVSNIYEAYGKSSNFEMTEDDAGHTSTKKNREAMYAFFQKHLNNPGNPTDETVEFLMKGEMQVTHTGQISTSLKSETVFSLNRKEAEKYIDNLLLSRKRLTTHLPKVLKSVKKLSGYKEPNKYNQSILTGRIQRDNYSIEKYFVKGEGDYVIPYLLFKPQKPTGKALIYLHPSGKAVEAIPGGEIEWFVKKGFTVLAPDLLGIGETGPGHFRGSAVFDSINFNTWYGSILIGRSIVGIRAGDVVRLAEILKKESGIIEIYGMSRQEMSPVLLHAAAFCPDISRIALIEPYSSYREIVMNKFYNPKFIYGAVAGALKAFDLPDIAASLAPRKLLMVNITDGLGNIPNYEKLIEDVSIINNAYQKKVATNQLKILTQEFSVEFNDEILLKWIE